MTWPKAFTSEGKKILKQIDFKKSTPQAQLVLRFLELDPNQIKVVILGQDPYPTPGVANGYAFAVNAQMKIPASLKNIFQEIKEIKGDVHADRTLQHWVNQGVLLLNCSLTTTFYQPNAHQKIWHNYIMNVIMWLDNNFTLTWVLWGNKAKQIGRLLNNKKIEDAHPSPLSVRRRNKKTFQEIINIDW